MTITPTAPAPAVVPAGAAEPGAAATVPGDFLALVQQALAAALGGAPDSASAGTGTVGAATGTPGATAAGATPALPGTTTGKGTAAGASAGPDPAEPAAGTGTDTGKDAALAAAAAGLTALVAPVAPVTPAGTGPVDGSVTGAATAAAGQALPAADVVAKGSEGRGTSTHHVSDPAGGPAAEGATTPAAPAATPIAAGDGGQTLGQHGDQGGPPQGDVPLGLVPTTAAAAPAVGSGPPVTATSPAAHVGGQVFPEVTSLVSRGNGTHRITLTLKPEALGEVRVVMTVRDGAVHVRLAAGHEAQQALLEGSNELSRLLERAGATETRIAVRDLSGATAPTTGTSTGSDTGSGTGPDLGQGAGLGAGDNRSQDQHAGTRAEHEATDGRQISSSTTGASAPRPVQSVTRTLSGVDVTM